MNSSWPHSGPHDTSPVVFVEGESDRTVVMTLAARLRLPAPSVVAVGGSKGARRAVVQFSGRRMVGLVDLGERRDFEDVLETVFVCDRDLEDELIRALGIDGVEAVIARQGELPSFRALQLQPALRERSIEQQLRRFFGGRSGNKLLYAGLLASALDLERLPEPLAGVLGSVAEAP